MAGSWVGGIMPPPRPPTRTHPPRHHPQRDDPALSKGRDRAAASPFLSLPVSLPLPFLKTSCVPVSFLPVGANHPFGVVTFNPLTASSASAGAFSCAAAPRSMRWLASRKMPRDVSHGSTHTSPTLWITSTARGSALLPRSSQVWSNQAASVPRSGRNVVVPASFVNHESCMLSSGEWSTTDCSIARSAGDSFRKAA